MTPAIAELIGWAIGLALISLCILSLVISERKRPSNLEDIAWRQLLALILFILGVLLLLVFLPFCLRTLADPTAPTSLLR